MTFDQRSAQITNHIALALGEGSAVVQSLRAHPVVPMATTSNEHTHAFGSFDPVQGQYAVRTDVMQGYPVLAISVQRHEAHHATDEALSPERRAALKAAVESTTPGSHEHDAALIAMRRYWFEPEVTAFQRERADLAICRKGPPLAGVTAEYWGDQLSSLSARAQLFESRYRMNVICCEVQETLLEIDAALRTHAHAPPSEAASTILQRVKSERKAIDEMIDQPTDEAVIPSKLLEPLRAVTGSLTELLSLPELNAMPETMKTKWRARFDNWTIICEGAAEEEQFLLIPWAKRVHRPN